MLHLVYGRAGSGKTRYTRELLASLCENGAGNLLLLTPEQVSFESERAMLRRLGPRRAQGVQVLSFTRLANTVFRQFGGLAGKRLDDGGRTILMSLALEEMSDTLQLFRPQAKSGEMIELLLQSSAELKMSAVSPEALRQAAVLSGDEALQKKAGDISSVLTAYDALVARSYLDPLDDLTRLRDCLEKHNYFAGYTVAVDSFKSFTVQELQVLRLILRQAENVTVTLCADGSGSPEHQENGMFSTVCRTAHQLSRMAKEEGVKIAPPVYLTESPRFASPALREVERQAFRREKPQPEEDSTGVTLVCARHIYEEAEFVASQIRRLVMEEGYRWRDITVILRREDTYRGALDIALRRWEVPCFLDHPRSVDAEPIMRFVLEAFGVVNHSFRSDEIFSLLKTGLSGLDAQEIALLENYTFLWNISGKKWLSPWKENPDGFVEATTEEQVERLEIINALREKVTTPLQRFAKALSDTDGQGAAEAIFQLLTDFSVQETLPALCHRLEESGQEETAAHQLRLWDVLMNILDQTALVLSGRKLEPERYAQLLRLVMQAEEISDIPQQIDEITLGTADRMRPVDPKVVFLMGAVLGEFPQTPSSGGVFSEEERKTLIQLGLPLSDSLEDKALEEQFLAYQAMTSPSEKLFVSWHASSGEETCSPSEIVEELQTLFPSLLVMSAGSIPPEQEANAPEAAFALLSRKWPAQDSLYATLRELFEEKEQYKGRLDALERTAEQSPMMFREQAKAGALFANRSLSATQIETYHLCRFQYFCRYGMNAKERRPAELGSLEYGSLMHFLLERVFRHKTGKEVASMEKKALEEEILALIDEYALACMGGAENRSARFRFQLRRLADSACAVIRHIGQELAQSRFEPRYFELELKNGSQFPPLKVPTEDGTVTIGGKIDRVDLAELHGETYVRIVDYKTGTKEFKLTDVLYGMNLQMLIYLAALIENGGLQGAGILYMPAVQPLVPADRQTPPDKIEKEAEKKLKMNGLVLDDPEVITAMEEKATGKYIPVALKNGEPARRDYVLSQAQLEQVTAYVKSLVRQMKKRLVHGDIAALPLLVNQRGCQWCPYFPVCGKEFGDKDVCKVRFSKEEALERMNGK
ncbi:MAG TPA: PD-(D/E)XK nuclease family protein [Candidatus Gallacutalibacter pullistercoris]|nr:PD-(D/E)XK nuclease family protein [Candidatus Gallacutalibacter pullistercoris]